MEDAVRTLKRQRTRMLLANLVYFTVLLLVGAMLFLKNAVSGAVGCLLVLGCLAGYLLLVRPMSRRYIQIVRETILRNTVCAELAEVAYCPKQGISLETLQACGVVQPSADTFMSREHISGTNGTMEVELADVTFPMIENGYNAMFNGVFVQLRWPGENFSPAMVERGETGSLCLPKQQKELIDQIGELIPGSLYLKAKGETLTLLLRGRFLCFRVNPLMQISEGTLGANPFPELEQALRLARLMRMSGRS